MHRCSVESSHPHLRFRHIHDQITRKQINLFPVVMDERLCREYTRGKAKMARSKSCLVDLIKMPRENLLLDSSGYPGNCPPAGQVNGMKLFVLFFDRHIVFSNRYTGGVLHIVAVLDCSPLNRIFQLQFKSL